MKYINRTDDVPGRNAESTIPLTTSINFQPSVGYQPLQENNINYYTRSPEELKSYDTNNLNLIPQKLRQKGDLLEF